ncbi:hypothetical protein STCU_11805 [Strigomonas culicis]|uniref:Uncharacterized protein n=1 Tax=Strigomonas culicis TaxID=28005 RepID=S9TFK7_9TRYP|nr:hypothetical protein STCU_11805 [Strigomonas culicis]|eukprot:EPY15729.1 hypothetical protein STCU_11805 [Strigomonas culicis]
MNTPTVCLCGLCFFFPSSSSRVVDRHAPHLFFFIPLLLFSSARFPPAPIVAMPTVDSSFVLELQSGEVLPLQNPTGAEANAARNNIFSAIVTTVLMDRAAPAAEAEEQPDPAARKSQSTGAKAKKRGGAATQTVRVSLIATVQVGKSGSQDITLASAVFAPAAATEDGAAAAAPFLLSLKSPFVFSSTGPVAALTVRTEVYPPQGGAQKQQAEAAVEDAFMVRLLGVQRTELTEEQVLLMTR